MVSEYAEKWGLDIGEQLDGGTVSVVIGAQQDNNQTVLKIHPPWVPPTAINGRTSAETEAAAFKIWGGDGAPKLLASDSHALLLEHIASTEYKPELGAREVAELVTRIAHRVEAGYAVDLGIPFLHAEINKRFLRASHRRPEQISEDLFFTAASFATFLSMKAPPTVKPGATWELVHGDLKAKNVLRKPDGSFAAIDPSPAIGSQLYDVAVWTIDKPEGITDRCEEIAEYLEIDPQIIGSMAIALAIPEICLASPARAEATLEYIKEHAETSDLEYYFGERFLTDNFMERYIVQRNQ